MCHSLNGTMTPYALKWSQMFASLAVAIGWLILRASEMSREKNTDMRPTPKTVAYCIYSINSLIGKLGTNDVNTADTCAV